MPTLAAAPGRAVWLLAEQSVSAAGAQPAVTTLRRACHRLSCNAEIRGWVIKYVLLKEDRAHLIAPTPMAKSHLSPCCKERIAAKEMCFSTGCPSLLR